MPEAQFGAITVSGNHVVDNASETLIFVHLGSEEIMITLPPAVAGRLIIIGISEYTSPIGTANRVRIVPDPSTPTNKINGNTESEIWVVHDRAFFCGLGVAGWTVF